MVEESWVAKFVDKVLIPKTRVSNALSVCMMPEPVIGRRIEWGFCVVAQKGNRVARNIRSAAIGSRLIINRNPKERHVGNDAANFAFQFEFADADRLLRCVPVTPCWKFLPLPLHQRRSDNKPKNRTSVISPACVRFDLVLRQARPELSARTCLQSVRTDPDNPWSCASIGANLTRLLEEINSSLRPLHSPRTVGKSTSTTYLAFEFDPI